VVLHLEVSKNIIFRRDKCAFPEFFIFIFSVQ
jgi:hypothetical protein